MGNTFIHIHSQVIKTESVNTARFPAHTELTENIYTECTLQLNPQHKGKLSGYARSRDRRRVGALADSIPLTGAVGSKVRYQVKSHMYRRVRGGETCACRLPGSPIRGGEYSEGCQCNK